MVLWQPLSVTAAARLLYHWLHSLFCYCVAAARTTVKARNEGKPIGRAEQDYIRVCFFVTRRTIINKPTRTSNTVCRIPFQQPQLSPGDWARRGTRWAKVRYLHIADCLPGKYRCTRMCRFIYRVQFHFLLGLTWTQLTIGIFAGMILFTILFSFVFLIVDPGYFADKTAEKMGG